MNFDVDFFLCNFFILRKHMTNNAYNKPTSEKVSYPVFCSYRQMSTD